MDNNIKIIYTGENDVVINQGYLSLTFCRDWFFSKDKKCYGIPVRMECTDSTGDAFFRIHLHVNISRHENHRYTFEIHQYT